MSAIKFLHESYSNLEQIISLVKEGRIILTERGVVNYFKNNYILKNDIEMEHDGYGFSWEDDSRLTRLGVPRTKVIAKGTKVSLNYEMWGNYLLITLKIGDYKFREKRIISDEEYNNAREENKKLFFNDSIVFNIIGTFNITLK